MNKKFDAEFAKVDGLRWIPWVGDNYENASCKVLLVGESVYASNASVDPGEHYDNINSNPDYVRVRNVEWWAGEGGQAKFPKNIYDILTMSNPNMTKDKFWNGVAFTEVIQEAIPDSKDRSRTENQFVKGLLSLYKTIEILSPDIVIFFGSSAMMNDNYLPSKKVLGEDAVECQFIDYVYASSRKYPLREILNCGVRYIGLPHPSLPTMSSNDNKKEWHNLLIKHAPGVINYFNSL